MVLDREYVTYRAKLPELLEKDAGRYVLIHGDDVIGIYDTKEQALNEGLERWLFEPYLVKQIIANEQPIRLNWRGDPFGTNDRCFMELDREYATFRAKLPELLEKDAGRYVLIHGDDVIGIWDTRLQALEEGYERWLFEPFLVEQIVANPKPIFLG